MLLHNWISTQLVDNSIQAHKYRFCRGNLTVFKKMNFEYFPIYYYIKLFKTPSAIVAWFYSPGLWFKQILNHRKKSSICMYEKKSPFLALFYSSKQIIQLTGNTSTQVSSILIKSFSVESLMRCCNLCLDSLYFIPVYTCVQ